MFKVIFKIIFVFIGIILIVKSLSSLVLSFLFDKDCPDGYRLRVLAAYLIGEAVIGLVCYFVPEKNPLDDFLYISHQSAALSSAIIWLNVLIYGYSDYFKLNNLFSASLLIASAFVFISFLKIRKKRESLEKHRQRVWWR